jgi:hypothetical protein
MSAEAFTSIQKAIDEYCKAERVSLLDDILSDFSEEYSDHKAIEVLERILGCYRIQSPASTPAAKKPRAVTGVNDSEPHSQSHSEPRSESCTAIMKSGNRQGCACGLKVHANNLCKRHQPKSPAGEKSEEKCPALMKAGTRAGQMCGAKVCNGDTYCGKHKVTKCVFKLANGECCGRSVSSNSPSETHCRIHVKNELSLDTTKFVTSLNRFGNMEHKYSGLVFEHKKVIGAQHPAGTIITNLTTDDFECVIVYGLPLDPSFSVQFTDYLNKRKQKET